MVQPLRGCTAPSTAEIRENGQQSSLCVPVLSSQPTKRESSLSAKWGDQPLLLIESLSAWGEMPHWQTAGATACMALHGILSSRSSPWKGAPGITAPLQAEVWPCPWMWIAPLHIGVDYIPFTLLWLQFDSNAKFLPVQCIYREHIGSHLQRGPTAVVELCSCVFFRCLLAVTPV